ncbi:MAG TPA: site-specific integrase [Vicinamibacterales bacterium]|nr:site-specific integrase [Vicinamibacterales bacterium]
MSVYLRGGVYWYDFRLKGKRFRGSTLQQNREDAEQVEATMKLRRRRAAAGLAIVDVEESPRIAEWAGVYYESVERNPTIARPKRIDDLLRVALRFWGSKPSTKAVAGEPYHDLRLLDPVVDPMWVEKYERWLANRKPPIAGQTKNQYRSVMRQLYEHAAKFTIRTGIEPKRNPFDRSPRDHQVERTVTLTIDELRRWIAHASYHVRLTIAIAALAPKLRLANVLGLCWSDVDDEWITVHGHKTAKHTGRPLVAAIAPQLHAILEDAKRRRRPKASHVIEYRGKPMRSIRGGLQRAAVRAELVYGRTAGITFHTIRHTMATMLAEMGEPESLRKELMGHTRIETTQRYTHIRPTYQVAAIERLSAATPLLDLVTLPWRRASAKRDVVVTNVSTRPSNVEESSAKPVNTEQSTVTKE